MSADPVKFMNASVDNRGHKLMCDPEVTPEGVLKLVTSFGYFEFKSTVVLPQHTLRSIEDLLKGERPL